MTARQYELAQALARCTFSPGTTVKRFVRWLSEQPQSLELTAKGAAFLERLGHSYRRQLGRCMAENCSACNATKRPCPACGAPAGKLCRTKGRGSKKVPGSRLVHAARLQGKD